MQLFSSLRSPKKMNLANLWVNYSPNQTIVTNCLARYGRLPKWKSWKENILEVGCGDGKITEGILYPYLKNHMEKLVAVDKNNEMIEFAKEQSQIRNIEYRLMDAMDEISVQGFRNQFDKIFTLMVAHWIPDNRSFFRNLFKMLKKNGQLFILTPSDTFIRQSYIKQHKEGSWLKYLPNRQPFVDYTNNPEEHLKKLLQSADFEVDFCKNHEELYTMNNFKEFVSALVHLSGDLKKIPADLREDYVEDHYKNGCELCTKIGEPDKYSMVFKSLVAIATKRTEIYNIESP